MDPITMMAAAQGVSMVVGLLGGASAGAAERAAIAEKEYNMLAGASIREEGLPYKNLQIDANYMQNFIQRLEGYNMVLDTQKVSAGYQGRTTSSLQGVEAAGALDFEFDKKIMELNRDQSKIAVNLDNTYANLGLARDMASAASARDASKTAQGWGAFTTVVQGATGIASTAMTYNKQNSTPDKKLTGFFGIGD